MYDKAMLKKLDIPALPKSRNEDAYKDEEIGFIARSALAMDRNLLIVSFYERGSAANGFPLPVAVLYITKTEYTTRLTKDGSQCWRTGTIRRVLGLAQIYTGPPKVVCLRDSDDDRIRRFLRTDRAKSHGKPAGIDYYIQDYQHTLLEKRLVQTHALKRQAYETLMATVPPLPESFDRWLDNGPLKKSRYIFYKRLNRKSATGYCSHCRSDTPVDVAEARHNKAGTCPKCGSPITFKAVGRSTGLIDMVNTCIIQKTTNGGAVLRYFLLIRDYRTNGNGWQPECSYRNWREYVDEPARLLLDESGKITGTYRCRYLPMLHGYGYGHCRDKLLGPDRNYYKSYMGAWGGLSINIWFRPVQLYPYNLRGVLQRYNLSFSLLQDIKKRQPLDVTTYLCQSIRYPVTVTFEKLGLSRLAEDMLIYGEVPHVYHPTGSLHRRLGISKEHLALARKHDFTVYHLNLLTSSAVKPSLDDLLWLGDQKVSYEVINKILIFTTMHKIRKYLQQQLEKADLNSYYLRYGDGSPAEILAGYWADYLEMSSTLEFNTKKWRVLFPKDVKDQHDKVRALVRVKHDPVMDEKIRKQYPTLDKKYSYGNDAYFLRPPMNFNEFIEEGAELLHCVASAGYFRGHVEGKSYIFLVRKREDPDTAFFTMQYNPQTRIVNQLRGYKDKGASEEVVAFRDEWLASMGVMPAKKAA